MSLYLAFTVSRKTFLCLDYYNMLAAAICNMWMDTKVTPSRLPLMELNSDQTHCWSAFLF